MAQAEPPAQPTGLSVSSEGYGSITIAWDDPQDGSSNGYQILRRSRDGDTYGDGQGSWDFVAIEDDTGTADTEYTDNSVTPETRYVYRVKARNQSGLSERSSYANAETPQEPQESTTTKDGQGEGQTSQQLGESTATLSSLTVNGTSVPGFASSRTEHQLGVDSTVEQVTLAATAYPSNAPISFGAADADADTEGHQVGLSSGANEVTITVGPGLLGSQLLPAREYRLTINRGVADGFGWRAGGDIDSLLAAGNDNPHGIWSDGTYIWVADGDDLKLYAYHLSARTRVSDRDIALDPDNADPKGIWSNGEDIWVVDSADRDLYAYDLESGERESAQDLTDLGDGDADFYGVFSDGETIWVSDKTGPIVEAFDFDTGNKVSALRYITLEESRQDHVAGIWSDGSTMWVVDPNDNLIHPYDSPQDERTLGRTFQTLSNAGNSSPGGIWSDGATLWVSDTEDGKIYSYNLPPSQNTDLSSITVDETGVSGVVSGTTEYSFGVGNGVTRVTLAVQPRHPMASSSIRGLHFIDADDNTDGHQVDLLVGRNIIEFTVTAQDGTTTEDYTISINRGSNAETGWTVLKDIEGASGSGNEFPGGIWSNGTIIWASGGDDLKLYAYNLATGERESSRDIALNPDNTDPKGIWSDGETIWVVDASDRDLYAYNLQSGDRDAAKDFTDLGDADADYYGIWSDGETIWLSDRAGPAVEAFDFDTGEKAPALRYGGLEESAHDHVAGIWSDGVMMLAVDTDRGAIWGYDSPQGEVSRHQGWHYHTLDGAGNHSPRDIWSDGETIWVSDSEDGKIYSYHIRLSGSTQLRKVVVDGTDAITTGSEGDWYAIVASTATEVTVRATAAQLKAAVSYGTSDNDLAADGHQLAIPNLATTVTMTVTAQNGDTQDQTLTIYRVSPDSDRSVAVGSAVTSDIANSGDFGMVEVDLVTDEHYRFDVEGIDNGNGALSNPKLLGLFKMVKGTAVPVGDAADFLGGQGANASEAYHVPKPEGQAKAASSTYYIVVGGDGGATGGYRLSVSYEDEATADASTEAVAEVLPWSKRSGKRGRYHFRGAIGEPGDVDWIKVTLEADQMYRIVQKSSATGNYRTLAEPILIGLYTGNGTANYIRGTMAFPAGHRVESRIHYYTESGGAHYVAVRGFQDVTGSYDLLVMEVDDDRQPDNVSTSGTIAAGETVNGKIDYRGDSDWFKAQLTGDTTYTIEISQSGTSRYGFGPTFVIYDAEADRVLVGGTSSDGTGSAATYTPDEDGTFYIAVMSRINRTGPYALTLSE